MLRCRLFKKQCAEIKDGDIFGLLDGKSVVIDGESYTQESFLVNLQPDPKFQHPCHANGNLIVAFDTELSDELKQEGYARELINRVQRFRKETGFNVEDRIHLAIDGPAEAGTAFNAFQEMIEAETLSTIALTKPDSDMSVADEKIERFNVKIGIKKRAENA